jgi:hypothetical protein
MEPRIRYAQSADLRSNNVARVSMREQVRALEKALASAILECSNVCPLPPSPPPTLYCPLADTQPNGSIDAVDALFCLQHVVGQRPVLQCSQ